MTLQEIVRLHEETASAVRRYASYGGVPDGFRMEYRDDSKGDGAWAEVKAGQPLTVGFYRLVKIEKPAPMWVPYKRETWPHWRYLKDNQGDAVPFGIVTNDGVYAQFRDGNSLLTWSDLTKFEVGDMCCGPWVKGVWVKGA